MARLKGAQPKEPGRASAPEAAAIRRLNRLAAEARFVLFVERLCRALLPPLLVAGAFVSLSWAGLWLHVPRTARGLGLLAFAAALLVAFWPARKLRFPSRREALGRIDRKSGLSSRPASALADRLGNAGTDPITQALWRLHRRRAEENLHRLTIGGPAPRLPDFDRYALRAAVLVGLIAAAFVAGPERSARLAAAFDWQFEAINARPFRVDAWIDPPAYTGKPAIVLNTGSGAHETPERIEAPVNSLLIIHASGGKLDLGIKGALASETQQERGLAPAEAEPAAAAKASRQDRFDNVARLVLHGDALLTLGKSSRRLAAFDIHAIPDEAPMIALTAPPRFNARGSMALKYSVADDYGVTAASADFVKPVLPGGRLSKRSLVDPPHVPLVLPPPPQLAGEAETTFDLSDHPWAGARVQMTLSARDGAGNEGKSSTVEITLPEKPFVKPLAKALAEQRRTLVLAPEDKPRVEAALEALMIAPELFDTTAGVYLGLRVALDELRSAKGDGDLCAVADYLWQMALEIESGDLAGSERDLRAAEHELAEALSRGASEDELRRLTQNLRAAMDKFLGALAAQQKAGNQEGDYAALERGGRTVTQRDLQGMLDEIEKMLRSGDSANAQKMLEQLQNILENLKVARPHKASPQEEAMGHALNELGALSEEQQDLRDDTYRSDEEERERRHEARRPPHFPGQPTFGDIFGDQSADDAAPGDGNGTDGEVGEPGQRRSGGNHPAASESDRAGLAKRQQALRNRLEVLEHQLGDVEAPAHGLDAAGGAMREAEEALGQDSPGTDGAVEAQGRAVEALRDAAQSLADKMHGESGGQADQGQDEQGGTGRFGDNEGSDPLGRRGGADRASVLNRMGVPAAERARRVLDELRRRLGEPARPREELDYIERLLRGH